MSDRLKLLRSGASVAEIHWALLQHPELWNQNTARTAPIDSPHHGLDDIWVRYGQPQNAIDGQPHDSVWYPSADILGVKGICYDVMREFEGDELGGVLITRIPPGASCKPHTDPGWHARRYQKYAIQIASAPGQKFHFESESLETKPGDVYWFDNQYEHWVTNDTPYERVTMIVCVRRSN